MRTVLQGHEKGFSTPCTSSSGKAAAQKWVWERRRKQRHSRVCEGGGGKCIQNESLLTKKIKGGRISAAAALINARLCVEARTIYPLKYFFRPYYQQVNPSSLHTLPLPGTIERTVRRANISPSILVITFPPPLTSIFLAPWSLYLEEGLLEDEGMGTEVFKS